MNEDSEGQVVIDQGDKKLTCDKFDANDSTKLIKASGKVEYKQTEGNWLIDSGLVKENEAEGEVVEEIKHPMTITTDTMSFDYDKRKLTAEGETVRIEGREGKNAECSSLTFDDKEKVLEMSGGVVISSGKEYMYCDSLRADTDNKVYEFFGDVDGFFKYQKRDEPDKPKEESAGATGSGGTGGGGGAGASGEGGGEGDGGGTPIITPRIEEEG
jgi:lipopolysaccharide assembly outer membrane protein LptD (OstA)